MRWLVFHLKHNIYYINIDEVEQIDFDDEFSDEDKIAVRFDYKSAESNSFDLLKSDLRKMKSLLNESFQLENCFLTFVVEEKQ